MCEQRLEDDRAAKLAKVEELCAQLGVRLARQTVRRTELIEIETALLLLVGTLEREIRDRAMHAGGTQSLLQARQCIDTMRQLLRWVRRYSTFAPESDLHEHLLDAHRQASNVLIRLQTIPAIG